MFLGDSNSGKTTFVNILNQCIGLKLTESGKAETNTIWKLMLNEEMDSAIRLDYIDREID